MRVFYILIFWALILLLFLLIPTGKSYKKLVENFYLREYFTRFLIVLNKTERNTILNLALEINKSRGCNISGDTLKKLKRLYDFYKIPGLRAVFGIWIVGVNASCYYGKSLVCVCYYDEFSRALKQNETLEVKEAGFVVLDVNIGNGNVTIEKIGIGYYRR